MFWKHILVMHDTEPMIASRAVVEAVLSLQELHRSVEGQSIPGHNEFENAEVGRLTCGIPGKFLSVAGSSYGARQLKCPMPCGLLRAPELVSGTLTQKEAGA